MQTVLVVSMKEVSVWNGKYTAVLKIVKVGKALQPSPRKPSHAAHQISPKLPLKHTHWHIKAYPRSHISTYNAPETPMRST
jgi:hypothetical protein